MYTRHMTDPESILINGHEVTILREGRVARVSMGTTKFTQPASVSNERLAEIAWQVAHPKPHPEAVKAAKLADERGEDVCGHCGGLGGWRGWPGFTCHQCNGRRTVPKESDVNA